MLHDPKNDYDDLGKGLLKAADYMAEHGHCKGFLQDKKGAVCLMGAVIYSYGSLDYMSYLNALTEHTGKYINTLVLWNNAPETTGEDVIKLFREAAEDHKLVKVK